MSRSLGKMLEEHGGAYPCRDRIMIRIGFGRSNFSMRKWPQRHARTAMIVLTLRCWQRQKPARLILLNPSPEPTALGLPFFDRTVPAAFAWNRHECPALLPRGYSITRLHLALAWLKALFAAAKEV